jgi:hypothetical protein
MRTSSLARGLVLSLVLPAVLLLACGGGEFQAGGDAAGGGQGGSGGGKGGATSGGSNGSGGSAGAPLASPCPSNMPGAADSCTTADLHCTYGDDPRPSCRSHVTCNGTSWEAGAAVSCTLDSSCPMTPPDSGTDCLSIDQICVYPSEGSVCGCPTCPSFCTSERWVCSPPPSGNCPRLLPNAGQPCSGNTRCEYGACLLGDAIQTTCLDGNWIWEPLACAEPSG